MWINSGRYPQETANYTLRPKKLIITCLFIADLLYKHTYKALWPSDSTRPPSFGSLHSESRQVAVNPPLQSSPLLHRAGQARLVQAQQPPAKELLIPLLQPLSNSKASRKFINLVGIKPYSLLSAINKIIGMLIFPCLLLQGGWPQLWKWGVCPAPSPSLLGCWRILGGPSLSVARTARSGKKGSDPGQPKIAAPGTTKSGISDPTT